MGWFMEKSTYFKTFGRFLFCFFLYNFGIFFYSNRMLHSNHIQCYSFQCFKFGTVLNWRFVLFCFVFSFFLLYTQKEKFSLFSKDWTCITNMTSGFKDNRETEKWNFYCKLGIQLLISRFFIFRSEPGFQIWVSNLRFTSHFNFSYFSAIVDC